ncbi:MAG: septal ring lytic transglycosylase RlpA family protein [Patescibacteria group bacterium]
MQLTSRIKLLLLFITSTAFFIFSNAETKACSVDIHLDAATMQKGYTVSMDDDSFRLGIVANIVDQEVDVSVKQLVRNSLPQPEGKRLISSIYQFDVQGAVSNPIIFSYPAWVSIQYDSEAVFEKELMVWDRNLEQWVAMPATTDRDNSLIKAITHLPFSQVAVFERDIVPVDTTLVNIDEATISKGYTVQNEDDSLAVGILHDSIDQPVTVELKEISLPAPLPENLDLISRVYQFDIFSANPIDFTKPIWLRIGYFKDTNLLKQIYVYDEGKKQWIHIPSSADLNNNQVKAAIHLKYAKIAVLEDTRYLSEGVASWYRDSRYPFGAANNDYAYDTELRVTNLETGESVIVKKYSDGPFVSGRVIDLVLPGFCLIADRYEGLARVKVEPVWGLGS